MNFRYKLRKYNNEDGEFTDYVAADRATIERLFSDNYNVDDSLKNFRDIAIADDQGQTIIIHYIKKGVCSIYFIPLDNGFYYFKKTKIELATQAVGFLLENRIADLTGLLNRQTENNDFIRGDFFNKSFKYEVTKSKNRKEISWIWYALPLGIAFIVLGIINFDHGAAILLFIIGLILWVPGVIIHYQYYQDNHLLQVTLSKGSSIINVTTPTLSKTFAKDDIKGVLKVDSGINRFTWGQYGFTRIEFKTGEIVNLTCLLVDQLFIEEKFDGFSGKTLKTETLIPTLDKKTRL